MRKQTKNIILIGMPGSGKTTIGMLLAERTGLQFVDADEQVVKLANKTIPDIFSQDGEDVFRLLETQVLEELGKQSGLIIATGGGCVTKERNYPHLHQNGTIFWLKRDVSNLKTDGRPLLQNMSPEELYRRRVGLYAAFADHIVDEFECNQDAVKVILEAMNNVDVSGE